MAFIALHSSAFQISMEENAFKNELWTTDSVQESGRDLESGNTPVTSVNIASLNT